MKIKILIILALFLVENLSYSQPVDINPDRPDQTVSPLTVGRGFFQAELGASIEKTREFNSPIGVFKVFTHSYPSVLIRYGISNNAELRIGAEFLQEEFRNIEVDDPNTTGLGPLIVGAKIKICSEKKYLPETAVLLSVSVPFNKESPFQSNYSGVEFRFAMAHTVSRMFSLSYNLGGEFGAGSPGAAGLYSFAVGASLMKKLTAFAEIYGFMPQKSSPDHRFDAGISYLVLKNVAVDASFGLGISSKSPDYFISGGVSLRLPK